MSFRALRPASDQVVRLLVGRTLSLLATATIPTALTLTIISTTRSANAVGFVLACELVPQLVLLPVGGVLADRLRPQRLACATDIVRGLAQLAIGIELLLGTLRIADLAVLSAVTGVAIAFGTPALSPLVVAAAPEQARLRVNARLGMIRGVAFVVGPGIVGLLIATTGPGWLFVFTSALFFGGGALLGRIRTAGRKIGERSSSIFADLAGGWHEVRSRKWFWTNLIGHGVGNFAGGIFMTLGPLVAVHDLGGEVSWFVIYQSGMVGMVLGAVGASRLSITRPLIATSVAGAVLALPLISFAFIAPVAVDAAAYFSAMLALGVLNTLWQTIIQQRFKPLALARVNSYDSLLSFAARPFGLALAAPIAALTSDSTVFLGSAVLVAVFNLGLLALPEIRALGWAPFRNP